MDDKLLPFLLLAAGALNLTLAGRATLSPSFAREYAETSPKAALWRKFLGVEKTTTLIRRVFGPLGIALSLGFVGFAGFLLVR